ncbi:MAG: oligosaccharide flippase family protein [Polyangiaceae bacterium]|nr:oligosaccharide flippase family protein [Polyangiaceae bacterium]
MILNTGTAKLASFGAQVVLGAILSADDFGLVAISTSIAALTSLLRDGGVRQVLVQRGDEYESLAGPVFWMGLAMNMTACVLLVAAAPALGEAYHEPELPLLLVITAVSVPLTTPSAVLSARLAIDLRFKAIGLMQSGSALLRYGGAILFAMAGFGAVSFVLPLLLVAIFEWVVSYALTRSRLWSRPWDMRRWKELFSRAQWVLLGTFGVGLCNTGTYFLLGATLSSTVVGVYFFAYQLVIQVGILLANNVNQVLFPALVKLRGEPMRLRAATERSLRMLMLVAAPLSLGLVAAVGPIETLVWQGRWAEAVVPVQVVSIVYPLNVALGVPMSLQLASGRFREWALMLLAYGAGLVAAGAVGAWTTGTAAGVASWTGGYIAAGAIVYATLALRSAGLRVGAFLNAVTPSWVLSIGAAGTALLIDRFALEDSSAAARVLASCLVFGVVLVVGARVAIPGHLCEARDLAPRGGARLVTRLLRL